MRVEPGQHAVDRVLDQLAVVDRFDIFGADALEHVAEQVEQPIGIRPAASCAQAATMGPTTTPAMKAAGHRSHRPNPALHAATVCPCMAARPAASQ